MKTRQQFLFVLIFALFILGNARHYMLPQIFTSTKTRAYNSNTKANLHNVYLACKAYWYDHGEDKSCDRPIFTATTYGYIQSRDVRIDATGGENDFRAVATNVQNGHWFRINELGSIIEYQP